MTEDEYAQRAATKAFIDTYFAATSQAEIDAAEAALRARSVGAVENGANVHTRRTGDGEWFGGLEAEPRGIRSAELFGETHAGRLIRVAHLELVEPVPHPGGGGETRVVPVIGPDLRRPVKADGVHAEPPCDTLYRELASWARIAKVMAGSSHIPEAVEGMTFALARLAAGWPTRTWDAWSDAEPTVEVPRIAPIRWPLAACTEAVKRVRASRKKPR